MARVRGTPEYYEAVEALKLAHMSEERMATGGDAAFGDAFSAFADSQSRNVKRCLKTIQLNGRKVANLSRQVVEGLNSMPGGFQPLADIHLEIIRRTGLIKSAEEQAKRSEAAAAENPNLAAKAIADRQAAEKAKAENENACNDLKKRFVDVICTLLLKTGEKREWENDQLCQIADEMLTAAKGITNVEDNVIPQLQKKLEELDYDIVD